MLKVGTIYYIILIFLKTLELANWARNIE